METDLSNKVAVVTGASSGIGRATALRLARDFGAVVLVARRADELEAVASKMTADGVEALVVAADLSDAKSATLVTDAATSRFGRVDALINIAGAVPGLDLFQMSDDQWNAGAELKLHGARRLTIAMWPALKATKGSVVFMSGNAAALPKAGAAAIGVINAAIEALAKAFAERGIEDDVQVNAVSPGAVMSPRRLAMLGKMASDKGMSIEDVKVGFLKQAGIKRFGEVAEIADLIAFAVGPGSRWMTGTVLRMDGGEVRSM
jgi:3-oxoacyl-[acyl-carrier protein] reductase